MRANLLVVLAVVAGALSLTGCAGDGEAGSAHVEDDCAQFRQYLADDAALYTVGPEDYPGNVLGDSISAGDGLDDESEVWVEGWSSHLPGEIAVDAAGGTGFVNAGPCGDYSYAQRIERLIEMHVGSLLVQGGNDDVGSDPDKVEEAAVALLAKVDPTHDVVLIGPVDAPAQEGEHAIDAALRRAARIAGRQYVSMIDERFDFQADGLHLSGEGQDQYLVRLAQVLTG